MMEKLFTTFTPTNAQEWKNRLEKDLKGITFEQLSTTDRNGITISPFYTREDTKDNPPPVRTDTDWNICTLITAQDNTTANKEALSELSNDVSGLIFAIAHHHITPELLLKDIELPYIYTHFRLTAESLGFAVQLQEYLSQKYPDVKKPYCSISYDCIANFINNGSWRQDKHADIEQWKSLAELYPSSLSVEGSSFHNAGANAVYELACILAQINEYLELYTPGQLAQLKKIQVSLAVDTAFFEQIAKLRALRNLVSLLCSAYNIAPQLHVHISTSNIYRSTTDSYNNLLRDTIAGMAAVLGGCNSLYIYPFDGTIKPGNAFSRRMSRNQQLIFKEESYLNKVADVGAGSYYIETLTHEIGVKAWEQFKSIENEGGLIYSFEKGIIAHSIKEQVTALITEYIDGKRTLIGVNKFPNPDDMPVRRKKEEEHSSGLKPINLAEEILAHQAD